MGIVVLSLGTGIQQVLNKESSKPVLTVLGQSRQSPHSPQVKAGPVVWVWFPRFPRYLPRDHPASLPATGQTPAQNHRNSWQLPGCQLHLHSQKGHTEPGTGNIVDPCCHTPRLESSPWDALECSPCPFLKWKLRLREVQSLVNGYPAGLPGFIP